MNPLSRFDPLRQLTQLDPFRGLDALFRGLPVPEFARQYEHAMEMRMDINEEDQAYVVKVDMPGVKKDAIDVSLDGNQVTIRAEVGREESRGHGKELYSERYSGQAFRSFFLPTEIDADKVRADYDGGVLTLTVPKKPGAGKRIAVH